MQKGWLGIDLLNTSKSILVFQNVCNVPNGKQYLLKIQQDRLIFSELFSLNFVLCQGKSI